MHSYESKKNPKPQPLSSDLPYIPCSFRLRELLQQVGTSGYDRPCTDRSRVLLSSIPSWSGYAAVSRRELCSKCIVSKNFKTRARRTYATAVAIPSSCAATHHDPCCPIFFKDPPSLLDGFYSLTLAHDMRGYIGPLCWHDTYVSLSSSKYRRTSMYCICMPRLGAPGFHAGNPPHTSNVCIMDSGSHCAGEICVSRRVSKIMWKEPPSWCLFCLHRSLRCMRVRGCAHGDFARRCCKKAGLSLESMLLIRC
jgi:hypothetical protein